MIYFIFPLIYIIANVAISLLIKYFISKKIQSNLMVWSYSISISLGLTFIIAVLFITIFAKDILKFY